MQARNLPGMLAGRGLELELFAAHGTDTLGRHA